MSTTSIRLLMSIGLMLMSLLRAVAAHAHEGANSQYGFVVDESGGAGMIPLNERHLRSVLAEWISHYNRERPHSALGPGRPDDPARQTVLIGHRLPATHRVVASARLGGLHHHYQLELIAA